jgi:D-glycero-alpha-D-manno-heptose-7-phosphate kinase
MKIITQAPTRIGLIGGGTDVNPFAAKFGGKILSLAINLCHKVTLEARKDNKIFLKALNQQREFNLDNELLYGQDKDFDLIRVIINHFKPYLHTGFNLSVNFSGLSTSGLGTSASVAVAIIEAFNKWLNQGFSRLDCALLAWDLENNKLGWLTGKQDQLAAAFGGINLLYFGPGEKVGIEPVQLEEKQLKELKSWTMLLFLNSTRNSGDTQKKLVKDMGYFVKEKALFAIKDGVKEAYSCLLRQDFNTLGKILDEIWINKKTSNPSATNDRIDKVYDTAIKNGALGGKVMGAGAGGHMFFLVPPSKQEQVKTKLEKLNVSIINFDYDFQGLISKVS